MIVNMHGGQSYHLDIENNDFTKGFCKYNINTDEYDLQLMKNNGDRVVKSFKVTNEENIKGELEKIIDNI